MPADPMPVLRQGVLPWPRYWATTWPFGTPIGPYFLDWTLTVIVILAIPTGDAFNFGTPIPLLPGYNELTWAPIVSDLSVLPSAAFNLLMAIGLYAVRWRRKKANLPAPQFRAWQPVVIFNILVQLYLVVMPWYPPTGGSGDVSFWYGTYVVTGVGILAACGVYYLLWTKALPRWRGYRLRQEILVLDNGAQTHNLVKIPVDQLREWDRTHDKAGRLVAEGPREDVVEKTASNSKDSGSGV